MRDRQTKVVACERIHTENLVDHSLEADNCKVIVDYFSFGRVRFQKPDDRTFDCADGPPSGRI
jgi:hypothetical protein